MSAERLATRVVAWQVLFTLAVAGVLYNVPPFLLLLSGRAGRQAALVLTTAVLVAGSLSAVQGWLLVHLRRDLLSHLRRGGRSLNQIELPKLNDDPWRIVNAWVLTSTVCVTLAMTALRPDEIPPSSALTLGMFAVIILAATGLPLLMLVRADFVRVMERVPPDVMADIIDLQVRSGHLRGRTSRRLLAAIVTPVAFLAIGASLIAGAHLRATDEAGREGTARAVSRGTLSGDPESAAVLRAQAELARFGYQTHITSSKPESESSETIHGLVSVAVPLQTGGVGVEFFGTTSAPVAWRAVPLALLVVLLAGWVGVGLGRLLSRDLRMANHGVRMLGTDAALEGTRVMRPARFRAVAELGRAIELLASRFRLFAQAQERSISARESATRARGRFFASVSHDLKSPLNAILGFAELCQREPLTNAAQHESLGLIVERGRELLLLIETILDAARVEAGQLQLERTEESLTDLLEIAVDKARQLSSRPEVLITIEAPDDVPALVVDRLRCSRALATLIGHAVRTAERSVVRVLVEVSARDERPSLRKRRITIYVEVPSAKFSARELEGMLSPEEHPGQHRGVALALRLAKAILELHGAKVIVAGRTVSEPAFAIEFRGRAGQ